MEQDTTGGDITQSDQTPSPIASAIDTPSDAHAPARARKPRRRGRWIAITIIVILLVILGAGGGAGYFAYRQYPAINAAGLRFCDDLVNQKYDDAYSLLSSRLRQRYSQAVFVSMNQTLDTTEGKATLCGQATSGAFQVGVFPLSVTVATEVTRATLGKREGNVTLLYENGHWRVDSLSTSLLGVNIEGLLTAQSLCPDMALQTKTDAALTQKYANIWALYGAAARANSTEADFIEIGRLHDQLDGKVEECSITSIGKSNTDTLTQVTYTAKHTYSTETQAMATLRLQNGRWMFTALDASVYGRDMAPALVATKWFTALDKGDCSAAYGELSAEVQKRFTLAQFTLRICDAPVDWTYYSLDRTAYLEESPTRYTDNLSQVLPYKIATTGGSFLGATPQLPYYGYVAVVFDHGSWKVDSLSLSDVA